MNDLSKPTPEGERIDKAMRAALGSKVTLSQKPDPTAAAFGRWVRQAAGIAEPEGKHGSD